LRRPLRDGIVPEPVVIRTEKRWMMIMAAMLVVMMAVIVVTGVAGELHPVSNVEVIEPQTLHLEGEFVESDINQQMRTIAPLLTPREMHAIAEFYGTGAAEQAAGP
jgi:hypothetical protein